MKTVKSLYYHGYYKKIYELKKAAVTFQVPWTCGFVADICMFDKNVVK